MVSKNAKKQRKLSKGSLLTAAFLPLFLLGKSVMPASAEEQKQKHDSWLYFEPIVSTSDKIEISNFYELEKSREMPDYVQSQAVFSGDNVVLYSGTSPITSTIFPKATGILRDVKNGTINSYSDLVNSSKGLSEMEKLVMFSAIGNSAYYYGYDESLGNRKVITQEDFFKKFQNILSNYQEDAIGTCRDIATNGATLANDSGLRTSAVTGVSPGGSHAYDISKLENATAVWDGGDIIIAQTKDIEKALDIYQFCANSVVFQHQFFEDSKFKYSLVTKDGKNYLDFLGYAYDPSTDTIKKALFNALPEVKSFSLNLTQKDYLSAGELNVYGFFVKGGKIMGDSLSPMKEILLTQAGCNINLTSQQIPGFSVKPALSFIYGNIRYKNENDKKSKDNLIGISGNIIASYNQKEGLNLSSRIGYNICIGFVPSLLFYNLPLEAGISYRFSTKNFGIEPYIISQFGIFPSNFRAMDFAPQFTELKTGVAFDMPLGKQTNIFFDPYYSLKNYERELGADAKLKIKNLEFNLSGYVSKSSYDFAPNRSGISLGTVVSLSDKSKVSLIYNNEVKNYDGETSANPSFSIGGTIKY